MNIAQERFKELLEAEKELIALNSAGVDNWEGYDSAFEDEDEDEPISESDQKIIDSLK